MNRNIPDSSINDKERCRHSQATHRELIVMRKRTKLLLLCLMTLTAHSLAGCADEDPASPVGDSTAPAAVTDLHIVTVVGGVVTLAWTAPGDDGDTGTASEYDIRYTNSSVTEGNWEACTRASTEPEPASPGTEQSAVINTSGDTDLYFAMKTSDEASNWSSLSNVVTASMGGGFVVRQLTIDTQSHTGLFLPAPASASWSALVPENGRLDLRATILPAAITPHPLPVVNTPRFLGKHPLECNLNTIDHP